MSKSWVKAKKKNPAKSVIMSAPAEFTVTGPSEKQESITTNGTS